MLRFAVAVQITLGFLSLILNQTLLSLGVSTHISLVCIYVLYSHFDVLTSCKENKTSKALELLLALQK